MQRAYDNEAGLHAALGRAECRQTRLAGLQQGEIVGQLAVQETGGLGTACLDQAPAAVGTGEQRHAIGQAIGQQGGTGDDRGALHG